jgi:tripartite-type tricarboxylate transporter receptor subunit TctC
MRCFRFAALLAALVAIVTTSAAPAQEWPDKPVRIIAPYAPGGSADTLGRLIAQKLGQRLKQNFVVENRPGAGGFLGSETVAKAAPDGYTLLVSGVGSHAIAPALSVAPYDPIASFAHVALFGGPPIVLAVHPSLGAKSLEDFIAIAKARPSGLAYGSPGQGTQGHLIGELFRQQSGAPLVHVPYKGAAPAIADLIANHVPAAFTTFATAQGQVRAGRARALALSAVRRIADAPQVPTFAESGYAELVATTWFGLSGPAGLPAGIVMRLNAAVRASLLEPEVRDRLRDEGSEPNNLDAPGYTEFIRAEIRRWAPLARAAK